MFSSIRLLWVSLILASISCSATAFPHSGVVSLSAGDDNTCALLADHHVACWGGPEVANASFPTDVATISSAIQVASGNRFACVVNQVQEVWCWGANELGQLGDGSTKDRALSPSPIPGFAARRVAARSAHACAVTAPNSDVYCWGSNSKGESGIFDGSVNFVTTPNKTLTTTYSEVGAGNLYGCALLNGVIVVCWGDDHFSQCGNPFVTTDECHSTSVLANDGSSTWLPFESLGGLTVARNSACVLSPEDPPLTNSVACWGDNSRGQVGAAVGATIDHVAAVQFPDSTKLTNVLSLAAGGNFVCAILFDHTIACWGDNTFGQLGNDSFTDDMSQWPLPVQFFGVKLGHITQLAAGDTHICAIAENGSRQEVLCWGNNDKGQLGIGSPDADYHDLPVVAPVDGPIFVDPFEAD